MSDNTFLGLFNKNKKIRADANAFWEDFFDLDFVQDNSNRIYLKRMAIDRNINLMARTISTTRFKYVIDGKTSTDKTHSIWMYKLNVRPNKNQNASDFWHKFICKLLEENEVLVIKNDDDDLLIADTFVRTPSANYSDRFSSVTVDDYSFVRSFSREDVFYLQYSNNGLEKFIEGLYGDYGSLFGRMIEVNMRTNQIRGAVDIDAINNLNKTDDESDGKSKIQNYFNKISNAIKNNSVALWPKYKGLSFDETQTNSSKNQSVEELKKLKNDFTSEVAGYIGIPPSLVLGEMAQAEEQTEFFLKFPVRNLINKLQTELIGQLIDQADYIKGHRIVAIGADTKSILEMASNIDKAISSSGFNRNEVRESLGYDVVEGGEEFILTKNYKEQLKGGDDINDNENQD